MTLTRWAVLHLLVMVTAGYVSPRDLYVHLYVRTQLGAAAVLTIGPFATAGAVGMADAGSAVAIASGTDMATAAQTARILRFTKVLSLLNTDPNRRRVA